MNDYSTLIHQASMGILVLFSLATWAVLIAKWIQLVKLRRQNQRYAERFWSTASFKTSVTAEEHQGQLARLANATHLALSKGREGPCPVDGWSRQEVLERSLQKQIHGERHLMEHGMIVLASIGSTAPFIGLFGTVFGIIHALQAISTAKSASIAVVAGPIGDALIATGIGIAVAVPAVLAYNFLGRRLKLMIADLESFALNLMNRAQRHGFELGDGPATETQRQLSGAA
ncbi:MotA/TolQ/ExbB proton channel family protein [Pseudomonas sp. GNP013]|jgi:biopolymer transport protein ExbB|uniref:MotA/TolQ/ExbB proton channel family protein n=1 Tax=Pseudomonas sp. MH9.3 TaxID=3048630 RepID=UPI002AC8BB67|nr:MotA/TolQ/ExbB proton channel family protein [Pseudomonas sp. MH9.3]MEB0105776.1 MotA/TolQ/ExbB proton channel family protein [Pseudomonas sp. MH9.3]WPX80277.1 MotA/TolQ/ExbB proton channel family protein [Pseudomonas sp. MH9.3]WQG57748.1 MotA/TolQ/ExbB proton channel family protein [Pseudomonas sp. RTB3]